MPRRKKNKQLKALIQRVAAASVSVDGRETGRIGRGLAVFIGVARGDAGEDVDYLVRKIAGLRIFTDEADRFNLSVNDIKGGLLLVSQFTLLADTRKGKRPSFAGAAPPDEARELFELFVRQARVTGLAVSTGVFGEHMQVEIHNDGPVTIMLDSRG